MCMTAALMLIWALRCSDRQWVSSLCYLSQAFLLHCYCKGPGYNRGQAVISGCDWRGRTPWKPGVEERERTEGEKKELNKLDGRRKSGKSKTNKNNTAEHIKTWRVKTGSVIDTCRPGHASLRTNLSTEWICWLEAISFVLDNNNHPVTRNTLTQITQTGKGSDQNYHSAALTLNCLQPNHNVYQDHVLKALCGYAWRDLGMNLKPLVVNVTQFFSLCLCWFPLVLAWDTGSVSSSTAQGAGGSQDST